MASKHPPLSPTPTALLMLLLLLLLLLLYPLLTYTYALVNSAMHPQCLKRKGVDWLVASFGLGSELKLLKKQPPLTTQTPPQTPVTIP